MNQGAPGTRAGVVVHPGFREASFAERIAGTVRHPLHRGYPLEVSPFLRSLLTMLAGIAVLLPGISSAATPEPVVDGNRIMDAGTAKVFVPHGVNFPGFEYACQQGWAYGEDGTEPDEIPATAAALAAWKINTVRLPLNQDCWLGEDGLPAGALTMPGYRNAVEGFVTALNEAGIVAILDLHWSAPAGAAADGLRPMPDDRSAAFWNSVASRFKERKSVIFDLFNEPHSRWGGSGWTFSLSWNCWASGGCQAPAEPDTAPVSGLGWYQAAGLSGLVAAVRGAGASQPILLSGIDYANDLRGWLNHAPKDDQLIAAFHNYPVQRCDSVSCWDREIAPVAEEVPVLAAEFGQNDCGTPNHMNRFMEWADGKRIGYLAWAWWYLPTLGCTNYALIADLDGTPLPPVGTALHDHLATLPDLYEPLPPDPDEPRNAANRKSPGLKLKALSWKRRVFKVRITLNRLASAPVKVRVPLIRDRRSRIDRKAKKLTVERSFKVRSGKRTFRLTVPAGLKPRTVIARFPGDSGFRPQTAKLKPASVSRLTRRRPGR